MKKIIVSFSDNSFKFNFKGFTKGEELKIKEKLLILLDSKSRFYKMVDINKFEEYKDYDDSSVFMFHSLRKMLEDSKVDYDLNTFKLTISDIVEDDYHKNSFTHDNGKQLVLYYKNNDYQYSYPKPYNSIFNRGFLNNHFGDFYNIKNFIKEFDLEKESIYIIVKKRQI